MTNNNNVHFSSEDHKWATPDDIYNVLDREFQFTTDVCANADTARCSHYYSVEDDGLSQFWTGTCWMNPPYGRQIGKWMKKAYDSAYNGLATTVCLVPARTDTKWWWDYAILGEIRFLKGRLKFGTDAYWESRWNDQEDKLYGKHGTKNSAPFPSAVVVFYHTKFSNKVLWWD